MGSRYSDRFFGPDGPPGGERPSEPTQPPEPPPAAAPKARYGDRFFGRQDERTAERTAPVARSAAGTDEIDLVGPDLPGAARAPDYALQAPTRPWHASWAARIALVAALLVGLGGGAYGWERWRDRQATMAAQSAVDLQSEVLLEGYGGYGGEEEQATLTVRLRNDGPHPVTVTGFSPADPRLQPNDQTFKPIEVAPKEDLVRTLNFDLECDTPSNGLDADDDGADDAVVAHLRTIDGLEHEEIMSFIGDIGYGGSITEQCSFYGTAGSFQDTSPDVSAVVPEGEDALRTDVVIYSYSGGFENFPIISEITSSSGAFAVAWDGVLTESGDGMPKLTLIWTVADCAQALAATEDDMTFQVKGRLPSDTSETTTSSYPVPSLVAGLVRLSERTCD